MQRMRSVLALVLTVLLTACEPVASLHSFWSEEYAEEESKLEGTWEVYEKGRLEGTWTFRANDGSYTLTLRDADEGFPETVYHVELMRLDGQLYFDAVPLARDAAEKYIHLQPMHTFYKLWVDENTLRFAWLDNDRLKSLLRDGRAEIKHEMVDSEVILTAPTEELQRLVRTHHAELFTEDDDQILYRRENRAYLNQLEVRRALDPQDAEPLAEHAELLMQQGRFSEARDAFEQVIALDPSTARYHDRLGRSLLLLGLPDRARLEFQEATRLGWNDRFEIGITYFLEQRYPEAMQELEPWARQNQQDGKAVVWAALAMEKAGRAGEARQLAEAFLQRPYPGQHARLVEFYLGRLTDDEFLGRTVSPRGQCEDAFYAGLVYFVRGDAHRACRLFRRATEAGVFDTLEYASARLLL